MNHKEMTAHIRNRIKVAGIAAGCSKYTSCGVNWIRVSVTSYEQDFTPCEQSRIKLIAQSNGLTLARGLPINFDNSTNPKELHFVMP